MVRSFIFSKGRLISQDVTLDFLKVALYDENIQIWVDAENPTEEETKTLLEGVFGFHPLSIEDCVTPSERPKIDDYETYFFMCIHGITYSSSERAFGTRELNIFVGKDFLVTYHRDPLASVTATRDRCTKSPAVVARATDRLIYNILDLLLDTYAPALDGLSAEIADLEKALLLAPSSDIVSDVLGLKSQIQKLRQIVAPQRDVIGRLAHGEFKLVRATMLPYYRDLLDRLNRIADVTETYRESLTGILQVQLNLQQNQTNRVVKVLTVLATLAMPALIVTSYYGMNIQHWPGLNHSMPFSYTWVFGITAAMTILIYYLLKKKDWL